MRARIVRAGLEHLAAHNGRPELYRLRLRLRTVDGELTTQNVVVPVAGHEAARPVYEAVLGDIEAEAWLATDGWKLAERLAGRELGIVIAPGAQRASRMRRV